MTDLIPAKIRSIGAVLFWKPSYGNIGAGTAVGYRKGDAVYVVGLYADDKDAKRRAPEFDMCARGIGEHYFEEYE